MADLYKAVANEINTFICNKDFKSALSICNNPVYSNVAKIQLLKMEIFYIQKKYNAAIEIACRDEFRYDIPIQLKLVQIYIATKEYDKGLEICLRPEFISLKGFIQLKNKILKDQEKLFDKLIINKESIVEEHMFKLKSLLDVAKLENDPDKKNRLYEQALDICNQEELNGDIRFVIYKIRLLKRLHRYEEALSVACDKKYEANVDVYLERIVILYNIGCYEEALLLINSSPFSYLPNYKSVRNKIIAKLDGIKTNQPSYLDILYAIKNQEYTIDDIMQLQILDCYRDILVVAFYEVNKYPLLVIKRFLKSLIKKYDNPEFTKVINKLISRLTNYPKIFDIGFYNDLIVEIDTGNKLVRNKPNN